MLRGWAFTPHHVAILPPDPCPGSTAALCPSVCGLRQPVGWWAPLGGREAGYSRTKMSLGPLPHPGQLLQHTACFPLQGVLRPVSAGRCCPPSKDQLFGDPLREASPRTGS